MNNEYEEFDHGEEIEVEAQEVLITEEPVELYKVLKLANLVEGGGQAKHLIGEGYVAVNGEVEVRKRRKTYDGDVVQVGDQFFVVMLGEYVEQDELEAEGFAQYQQESFFEDGSAVDESAEAQFEEPEATPVEEPLISRKESKGKKDKKAKKGGQGNQSGGGRPSIDFF